MLERYGDLEMPGEITPLEEVVKMKDPCPTSCFFTVGFYRLQAEGNHASRGVT
jgi:hypothetical protein